MIAGLHAQIYAVADGDRMEINMKKLISLLLLLALSLPLVSCSAILGNVGDNTGDTDSAPTDDTPTDTPTDTPSDAPGDIPSDTEPDAPLDSDDEMVDDIPDREHLIEVGWSAGCVTTSGEINPDDLSYVYSDVISLGSKGTKITFTFKGCPVENKGVLALSSWRLEDGEWVIDRDAPYATSSAVAKQDKSDNTTTYTYVSSANGENVRFCYYLSGFSDTPYVYSYETQEAGTLADLYEVESWTSADRERAYYDILEGKTVNFIGDSLFAGHSLGKHYTWPALIGAKYNMTYENYGISGCTLSACEGGQNPIVNRFSNMPDNDPDIVVLEGGRNDYNKNAALGAHNYLNADTYKGALAMTIAGLREKYPNAVIVCVTFWRAGDKQNDMGYSCNDYNAAMLDVCQKLGVPCIDASIESETGIYMTDKDFRTEYSLSSSDVCHLNYEGMKLALAFFERKLAEIYAKETK